MEEKFCLHYKSEAKNEPWRCILVSVEKPQRTCSIISLTKKAFYEPFAEAVNITFFEDSDAKINAESQCVVRGDFKAKTSLCNCHNYACAIESYLTYKYIANDVTLYEPEVIFQTKYKMISSIFPLAPALQLNTYYPSLQPICSKTEVIVHVKCPYTCFYEVLANKNDAFNTLNLIKLYVDALRRNTPVVLYIAHLLIKLNVECQKDSIKDIVSDNSLHVATSAWSCMEQRFPNLFEKCRTKDNAYILRLYHPKLGCAFVINSIINRDNLSLVEGIKFPNRAAKTFAQRLCVGGTWLENSKIASLIDYKTLTSINFYKILCDCLKMQEECLAGSREFYEKLKEYDTERGILLPALRENVNGHEATYYFFSVSTCIVHLKEYGSLVAGFLKVFDMFAKCQNP